MAAAGVNDTSTKPIGVRCLVEVNGCQWKSMEVNGRPQLQIAVAERKLLHVSLSMSPGTVSQFANLQCISDRIQDLPVSTGRLEVVSGKWQVSQWTSMEVNGRPQLQIAVAERILLYVSLSMSPGIVSEFPNLQCIRDHIQDHRESTGRWEVASGKWQVASQPTCMSLCV
jgi:hypothetical protein